MLALFIRSQKKYLNTTADHLGQSDGSVPLAGFFKVDYRIRRSAQFLQK